MKYGGVNIKVSKYHKYQRYGAKYGRYGTVKNGTKFFEMGSLRVLERGKDLEQRQIDTGIFPQGDLYSILGLMNEKMVTREAHIKK